MNPAARGQRHEQMVRLALALLQAGIVPEAVFVQLRAKYDKDVPDDEISGVIDWASSKCQRPVDSGEVLASRQFGNKPNDSTLIIERVERWLNGLRVTEADLLEASPWRPPEDLRLDAPMLFAGVFDAVDHVNIVTEYDVVPGDPHKARPRGAGVTRLRDDWLRFFREEGTPESDAGAWVRLNPVRACGSGQGGAYKDADIEAHRFLLVESDILPPEHQLSMLAALPFPVVAIIDSGGRSYHAEVQINAKDQETYRNIGRRIFKNLTRFGFDPQTANSSRLSRLPGVRRQIGAVGEGRQRLIYLNPDARGNQPIFRRK